jgi:hypothetical protein
MDSEFSQKFRYLDSDADRHELVADIRRVRQTVIAFAEAMPSDRHFEPRYHGWTLAALLAHLNTIDTVALLGMKLTLLGIHPPFPLTMLNQFNDATARVFQRRLVATTVRGIRSNEQRITSFILTLPMDRFTREIYHPPSETYLTIEQALQQYFLFHWQEHLQTLQRGEGIYYEPPESTTLM